MTNEELYAWRDATLAQADGHRLNVKPCGNFRSAYDCAKDAINSIVDMAVESNSQMPGALRGAP